MKFLRNYRLLFLKINELMIGSLKQAGRVTISIARAYLHHAHESRGHKVSSSPSLFRVPDASDACVSDNSCVFPIVQWTCNKEVVHLFLFAPHLSHHTSLNCDGWNSNKTVKFSCVVTWKGEVCIRV